MNKFLDLVAVLGLTVATLFIGQRTVFATPVPPGECGPICKEVQDSYDCKDGICLHTDAPSCFGCRGTNPYNCRLTLPQGNWCYDTEELTDVRLATCDHCPCEGFTAAEAWNPTNLGQALTVKHSRHGCATI